VLVDRVKVSLEETRAVTERTACRWWPSKRTSHGGATCADAAYINGGIYTVDGGSMA
jgi:hypothetical protein